MRTFLYNRILLVSFVLKQSECTGPPVFSEMKLGAVSKLV